MKLIKEKSDIASEQLVAMIEHQGRIYVAGGNKIWCKYPDKEEFIQCIFINGKWEAEE